MALSRKQIIIILLLRRERRRREAKTKLQKVWVRHLYRQRKEKGEYSSLIQEMKIVHDMLFYQQFRMTPGKYKYLLRLIAPKITKSSVKREVISPGECLAVTLQFLATGDAQTTIAASYRMSKTSVHRIVKETSDAIWDELLKEGFLKVPCSEEEWKSSAFDFEEKWTFPNCVGAIDNKHQ